ncbi:MAG: response regulator transcription factor [Thermoanaerobaculia bacterium]
MRPLAIIEPDTAFSASLRATLEAAGFRAECFTTATNALAALRGQAFALAILGLDLRDTDPYAVCREVSAHLPIITVADECGGESCVRALECGADDCIVRTTSGRELVARVHSVLRRTPHSEDYDSLETSLSEMRIRAGNTTHDLTRGETEVLAILLQHAPAPVTVTRMSEVLHAKRGTVESRIKSLRKKLGKGRLVSRGSLGYQLVD